MSIKAIYSELKWLISQTPSSNDSSFVATSTVNGYHDTIDRLSAETGQDYSRFKLTDSDQYDPTEYWSKTFRANLGRLIGNLEGEYDLAAPTSNNETGLNVSIINSQTLALTINQTLQQLIEKSKEGVEKENLKQLKEELEKPQKDWTKIKALLKWSIDFSEKLFFQLLPIVLKHYGVS